MLKVKLVPMTLMVPVIDNSGDHDRKMSDADLQRIKVCLMDLEESMREITGDNGAFSAWCATQQTVRQGVSQNALAGSSDVLRDAAEAISQNLRFTRETPPVSQIDPPIDTTVRDSEMRSNAPEMTLDELRERPERTKTPPRPRANSWRHE